MLMRKNRTIGIYCIKNLVNNKIYIGQSTCIEKRWSDHLNSLRKNCNDNRCLQEDWNKYGESSFSFCLLESCSKDELDGRESFYISQLKANEKDIGYNFTSGGKQGFKHNPELLKLESKIHKQKYEDNPELREQRRVNALKQWSNPEIKAKHMGENNGMYGKTHTEEARRKISEKAKGRISQRRKTVPVKCMELNKIYSSGVVACVEIGLNKNMAPNIYRVCDGVRKTCGGYTWKYAE